ncbi:MAG: peptidyl-prolyl cis-trans isomerase [Erythrobacter sp.]|nr:MAG: peptidyl-prolyl cis-trans isomerase [Erythrobacter sp.]
MIQFFRRFFQSKIGIGVTLGFLALIALAFASSDVANTGMFGGVAGGDRVAVVGDRTISTSDLSQNANNALRQAREENPTLSMEGFVAQGGFDDVIEQMLSRAAIAEFAEILGLRAGTRLVDSELVAGGATDAEAFRAQLRQRGLTESLVRDDLAMSLLARQSVVPIAYQARMPSSIARTYAQLLGETRTGTAAMFPAEAFAPAADPTAAQLQEYYDENRASYIRPERRVIRYAAFGADAVGDLPPVTNAQIAARYEADQAQYQATERRSFTQLVVPTQAAAQAVIAEVRGGMSLEDSATSKGLATTTVEAVERADYASTASQAVAAAGFDAAEGALAGPVQGSLGWYVLRVNEVTPIAGRTLAQASEEIRETLLTERRAKALEELTERLDTEFSRGRTLEEAARELGIELEITPPLLATGQVYEQQTQAPPQLARAVGFAFELDEGQAAISELEAGETFLIFDVAEITRSATAPLAEIRPQLVARWKRDRGMAAAGQAAERVRERVEGGMSLADALREEDVALPAPQALSINRRALAQQQQITRATILFFSMAEGTVKRVAEQETSRWFVVELDEIETAELAADSSEVMQTALQLSSVLGEEYVEHFVAAAQASLDIERNEAGIEAVRAQLTGATN